MAAGSYRWRLPEVLTVAILALLAPCKADSDDSAPTPTITTAPIFVPYYDQSRWKSVRGSIIGSDDAATATTYTIFCPTETDAACDLALEFPFVIVEGPGTLQFHGTLTSTYIADLECDMKGTTSARCSGYSSYGSGYTNGKYTGPTEVSWTSTFTGSQVQWGTLTLADEPTTTDAALDVTGTNVAAPKVPSSELYNDPSTTAEGAGVSIRPDRRWIGAATVISLITGLCMG